MSSSFAHDRIVGMEKIPFVVMVALLVLRLSVEVLGNAGKGHLYNTHLTQISLILHGIPTERYWRVQYPGKLKLRFFQTPQMTSPTYLLHFPKNHHITF